MKQIKFLALAIVALLFVSCSKGYKEEDAKALYERVSMSADLSDEDASQMVDIYCAFWDEFTDAYEKAGKDADSRAEMDEALRSFEEEHTYGAQIVQMTMLCHYLGMFNNELSDKIEECNTKIEERLTELNKKIDEKFGPEPVELIDDDIIVIDDIIDDNDAEVEDVEVELPDAATVETVAAQVIK